MRNAEFGMRNRGLNFGKQNNDAPPRRGWRPRHPVMMLCRINNIYNAGRDDSSRRFFVYIAGTGYAVSVMININKKGGELLSALSVCLVRRQSELL